jgi:hypothetical protein
VIGSVAPWPTASTDSLTIRSTLPSAMLAQLVVRASAAVSLSLPR